MPAATPVVVSTSGTPLLRLVIYAMYGISTNDTVQCSNEFKSVKLWAWIPATGASVASLTGGGGGVTGNTTVTIGASSISVDDGYLIVFGASAQQ